MAERVLGIFKINRTRPRVQFSPGALSRFIKTKKVHIKMLIKVSQTFSKSLSENLGILVGTLFGIFFIFIFSCFLSIILLIFIVLRKFVFSKSKAYKWTLKIAGLLISMVSFSFMTKTMALPDNAAGLVIIPLVPFLIGLYCVLRLR